MKKLFAAAVVIAASLSLHAATFVVPADRDLIHRADAIVLASPLSSYTQLSDAGSVETVTVMSITEVLRGDVPGVISIVEPGGTYRDVSTLIAGVPQFSPGDKLMLFLRRTGADRWAVEELVLGKFRFATDNRGRDIYPRFSPDGRWIAFSSNRYGNNDVFVIAAEGGAPRRLTSRRRGTEILPPVRKSMGRGSPVS